MAIDQAVACADAAFPSWGIDTYTPIRNASGMERVLSVFPDSFLSLVQSLYHSTIGRILNPDARKVHFERVESSVRPNTGQHIHTYYTHA